MKRFTTDASLPSMSWTWNRRRGIAGLGALTVDASNTLRDRLAPLYRGLDQLSTSINNLVAAGYDDREAVAALHDTREALREQADALLFELETLEPAGADAWNVSVGQLEQDVAALSATIRDLTRIAPTQRKWSIGVWLGVAVVGAIGAGLTIRYLGRRRG